MLAIVKRVGSCGVEWAVRALVVGYAAAAAVILTDLTLAGTNWTLVAFFAAGAVLVQLCENLLGASDV